MKKISALLAVAGVVALYAFSLSPRLGFGGDAVDFLRLAHSIAGGEGYTIDGRFVVVWPPVAPVLMAGAIRIFGAELVGLKILNSLLALAGLALAGTLLARTHERWLGWMAVALAAVSFPFIYNTAGIGMEPTYIFFSMLGLLMVAMNQRWPAGLSIGLAVLSRVIGVSLLGGLGLYALIRREWKKAGLTLFISLIFPALWYGYSLQTTGTTNVASYAKLAEKKEVASEQAGYSLSHRVKDNIVGYIFIFSNPDASLRIKAQARLTPKGIVSAAIMLLAAGGFLWHLFRRPGILECYLLCYAGLLLIFNWYDIRYLVPVLVFVFYYMGYSVDVIARRLAPKFAMPATATFLGALILANLAFSIASPQAKRFRSPTYQGTAKEIHEAALWVKQNHPESVVMTRWVNMVWYWTRLKVVAIPALSDADEMWRYIDERKVEIIMDDPDEFSGITEKYLRPALTAHPERLEVLTRLGRSTIYRVR